MSGEGRGGEVQGLRAEDLVKLVNFAIRARRSAVCQDYFSLIVILDRFPLSTVTFGLAGTGRGLDWVLIEYEVRLSAPALKPVLCLFSSQV